MNMKQRYTRLVSQWGELGTLDKITKILKVFLIMAGLSVSIFSILTYISLETILYNIEIPNNIPELNLDFSHYSKIQNTLIRIPYRISNKGFVDINRIHLKIKVDISYTQNITYQETQVTIFSKEYLLGDCPIGKIITGEFRGDFHDLNTTALGIYMTNVDRFQEETRLLTIALSAYLAKVIHFQFSLDNISIKDGECNDCG
jgi:hypothetical protein